MIRLELPKYRYRVDADDVLVELDSWWLAFARENGAAELTEERVLGRSLWDFVADASTQKLYQGIHQRVRSVVERVVLPFRCDSPSVRRHMQLTITRGEAGRLDYECLLLRAEPRSFLGVLAPDFPRTDALLTLCSCCRRALIEPAGWLDIEEAAARLGLFEQPAAPQLRHSVCPDCVDVLSDASGNDR